MKITPQSSIIHKEPKNKQQSTKKNFHCNSSLMLGMMDGKLRFNKGKFVGLWWVLKLGDDGDGLGRDVIKDLNG